MSGISDEEMKEAYGDLEDEITRIKEEEEEEKTPHPLYEAFDIIVDGKPWTLRIHYPERRKRETP